MIFKMPTEEETKATRQALQTASTPPPTQIFATLITANHILHYHQVVGELLYGKGHTGYSLACLVPPRDCLTHS